MIAFIHSATVLVRDQEAAIDFYVNKLGFEKRSDAPFGENSRWIEVAPPGRDTGLALLRPADTGQPDAPVGIFTGISLIADNVEQTYHELTARGVNFTTPPQRMPWGAMATWLTDPDGNSFFLTEGS